MTSGCIGLRAVLHPFSVVINSYRKEFVSLEETLLSVNLVLEGHFLPRKLCCPFGEN